MKRSTPHIFVVALGLLATGAAIGWLVKPAPKSSTASNSCLRLSGYTFIKPLLTCDTTPADSSEKLLTVQAAVEKTIAVAKKDGSITTASVYLRDLVNRQEMSINGSETFYPASLKKVPLMMQYYKESETKSGLLAESVVINDPTDYNADAVITPKIAPAFGKSYSNAELINLMISYSDNTSFQVLLRNLGIEKFNQPYLDLQLFYPDNVVSIDDYMTPYQFSLFFRTLFNATYLSKGNSEAALSLLASADYKNGLVAGVPESVRVAHKFGVGVVTQPDGVDQGELHDCGIIYQSDSPYLLCVMTKSKSLDITKVEETIAEISRVVYAYAKNDFERKD